MNQEDHILQATQGNGEALEKLLRRYRPWMGQVALHAASLQLRRYADTDEIVQHALTTCFRLIKGLEVRQNPQKKFEAWLATVVHNAVRHFGRKRKLALLDLASNVMDAAPQKGPTASKLQRRKERYERLNAAIAKLPEDTQAMFELRLKGMTLSQIATALGVKRATVNSRISRALEVLRETLGSTSLNFSSE
ncbi:MAG: sigma-70 family RNA polymerase sigma factor [Planctomycetia bacterium]|nr:sigma-70 family RNA polymerase sigma factor [Planctomycetia bacterium]